MKKIILLMAIVTAVLAVRESMAQNINWRSLTDDHKHVAQFNFGYDYGMTTSLGYSRLVQTIRPVLLSMDYSFPAGGDLVDDFKVRYGGQIEVVEFNNFSFSARIMSNFRRHETDVVRMVSFGAEFAGLVGYYKPTWHLAGEFGFDKAIVTHVKHRDTIKEYFPDIYDGWILPSGGNFFYGLQASKTVGRTFDATMRIGATNAEGDDEDAAVPFYFQLGLNKRF